MKTPFFIEAISTQNTINLQICRKIISNLFKKKITPLPFASTLKEYNEVLHSLPAHHLDIGLFIINTYFAEGLIKELSPLFPVSVPILSLRREICSSPFNLPEHTIIEWVYGSKNVDQIAEKGHEMILSFLNDGEIDVLEDFAIDQKIERIKLKD
jgi:hypothetical protein